MTPPPSGASEQDGARRFPRRSRMYDWTPAERAIQDAVNVVELMGADVRLTDAVILLGKARDSVADFVDGVPRRDPFAPEQPAPSSGPQARAGEEPKFASQAQARRYAAQMAARTSSPAAEAREEGRSIPSHFPTRTPDHEPEGGPSND